MTAEKILDRVRALLAKAESTTHDGEREVYMAKAIELIAKYGIDEALLAAKADTRQVPGHRTITIDGQYRAEKALLLGYLMSAFGGRWIRLSVSGDYRRRSRITSVTLVGFEADIDRAELLYTSLLLQAMGQLGEVQPPRDPRSFDGPAASQVAAYRRSWLHGFAVRIYQRVKQAETNAAQQAEGQSGGVSTALVLVDRKAQVDRYYEETFTGVRPLRSRRTDPRAYQEGVHAGDRADIDGKRVGSGSRRALA